MRFKILGCTVILLMMLSSCNKQVSYIGTTSPSDNPYLLQLDTFDMQETIYAPDSFKTAGKNAVFAGIQKDAVYGVINCTPYFRLSLPAVTPEPGNNSYFDSIRMVIKPARTYYGDTNSIFRISLNRLQQDMTHADGDIFYNNHSFLAYPASLGEAAVQFHPTSGDSIVIKLDDAFGLELFNLFKEKSGIVTDSSVFKSYYKGFQIKSDAGNNVIYSLPVADSNFQVRLYYHDDIGKPVSNTVTFPVEKGAYNFTNIAINRSGTPLAPLDSHNEMEATDFIADNELTQVRTRLRFPSLKDIQKLGAYVKILDARLEVKPVVPRYTSFYKLPPALNLYTYDIAGAVSGPLYTPGTTTVQTGNLSVDDTYGRDTKYIFYVSDYLATQLTATSYTAQQLVLITPDADTNLVSLVAGTAANSEYKTRLIVSLLLYNE